MNEWISAPLTRSQREYIVFEESFPETRINAVYGYAAFQTCYDDQTLITALRMLTDNEQGLRLRIMRDSGGEYRQYDATGVFISPEIFSFTCREDLLRFLDAERQKPLPWMEVPLVRFSVLRAEHRVGMLIAAHHIAADGYMLSLLASRAGEICDAVRKGEPVMLTPHEVFSYAFAEEAELNSPRYERDLAWWRERYRKWDGPCRLMPDRAFNGNPDGARLDVPVPRELWKTVSDYCKSGNLSPAVAFEAAWVQLLRNRNPGKRQVDICLNVFNRSTVDERNTVGSFAAGRMLIITPDAADSFRTLCKKASIAAIQAARHYTVQSDELLPEIQELHPSCDSLYDLECSYLPPIADSTDVKKTWLSNNMPETTAEFTLFHLNASELPRLLLDYRVAMMSEEEARTLLNDMLNILKSGICYPDSIVGEITL